MAKQSKITKKDLEVMGFIDKFWREHFFPPTYDDIGKACGIVKSHVQFILFKLGRKGELVLQRTHPVPHWVRRGVIQEAEYENNRKAAEQQSQQQEVTEDMETT